MKVHIQQLNNMVIESTNIPSTAIVVMDASIKNNITTSILHTHLHNKPITKTLHHIVHVTSSEAKLSAIRCGINQATSHEDISKIIVITDSIHIAKIIFNTLSHLYQVYTAAILSNLHNFFLCHQSNSIEFWECSS